MITRVGRLVHAEFIKLLSQPFLYLALMIILWVVGLAEGLGPIVGGKAETVWRSHHAIRLFAYGFEWGLRIAGFVLVIFSSMMFAGEFDRGTIKNMLTRPITRTDFFVAKCLTVLVLGVGLYLFVLYGSLALALARGDLGPVWLADQYLIQRPYEMIVTMARKAVVMSFLPFLAAGFLWSWYRPGRSRRDMRWRSRWSSSCSAGFLRGCSPTGRSATPSSTTRPM